MYFTLLDATSEKDGFNFKGSFTVREVQQKFRKETSCGVKTYFNKEKVIGEDLNF